MAQRAADAQIACVREEVSPDFAVQLGRAGKQRQRSADPGFLIEVRCSRPGHGISCYSGIESERLAPYSDVAVHRTVHAHFRPESENVSLYVAVHNQAIGKNDQIAVHVAVNPRTLGGHDEIGLHLLPGRQRIAGIAVLHIRGRHRLRQSQCADERAHHECNRSESLPLLPQQPDYERPKRGHRHEFRQASHRIPSFPESTGKKEHGQKISLRETRLRGLREPRFHETAPERVGAARAERERRDPAPMRRAAFRRRDHTSRN